MHKRIIGICAAALIAATAVPALGGDTAEKAKSGSPEFERMKSLVGTWKGTADMGQGPMEMTVEYRVIAGGSVVEERDFPGTPHEMVTMYYDKNGKLAMTHYCVMGNRPAMTLKSSDAKTIKLDFDKSCGIDPKKESHMHAITLRFEDPDTLVSTCKALMDGKETEDHAITLKRVKST